MSLRAGKLPAEALAALLARVDVRDPRVLVGPGIGRDAAVIDLGAGRALVAKTDPITFATRHIGWYAVHVNANDVACMGARPAWFMATALLPEGAGDDAPADIFDQIVSACASLDVTLIGGHTEISPGIDRPIIAGAMLGEAATAEIVSGQGVAPGDAVLLTQSIGIEGAALLATDAGRELAAAGVAADVIARAAGMLFDPGISIVAAARAICETAAPRLLHDPTEGGVATALQEMAVASGATVRVHVDRMRIEPETARICSALEIDPLGLLGSGALLAVVDARDADRIVDALRNVMIPCSVIGGIEEGPPGVIMGTEHRPLPAFERDELARYFSTRNA
jgi:hydrogenase maturation factor